MLDNLGDSCKNLLPIGTISGLVFGGMVYLGFKIETSVIVVSLVLMFLLIRGQTDEINRIKTDCEKKHATKKGSIDMQTAMMIIIALLILYLIFTSIPGGISP